MVSAGRDIDSDIVCGSFLTFSDCLKLILRQSDFLIKKLKSSNNTERQYFICNYYKITITFAHKPL